MKQRKEYQILIVGKKPYTGKNRRGIGGVGIHVTRLIEWLELSDVNYSFYDLSLFNFFTFVHNISLSKCAHLHSSSPYFRLLFSIVCRITKTNSICTYHGDLGRFSVIKNYCDFLSIRFMDYPIVLNEFSLEKAIKKNSRSLLISAYIPPTNKEELNKQLIKRVSNFRERYKKIIVTNAFAMNYDKNGEEIYGIKILVEIVQTIPNVGLIISDASGDYSKFYANQSIKNVLFINEPHPFVCILPFADAFIRNTSTDGDSLSIHEALEYGLPVITTDAVSRPAGCIVINKGDHTALKDTIISLSNLDKKKEKKNNYNVELFNFYREVVL